MIVCKKNIVNRRGEREQLNVYSSAAECKLTGEPHKIIKRGGKTLGYVGLTRDLDTPKASSKRVKIKDKVYVERKYLGKNTFYNYMQSKYPSSYKTITKITSDMFNEDTSDSESVSNFFAGMSSLESDIQLDTRNCKYFVGTYEECNEIIELSFLDTSKAKNTSRMYRSCYNVKNFPFIKTSSVVDFSAMYANCKSATTFPELDTSNGERFDIMYANCSSAMSFPQLDTRNGINFSQMYLGCSLATSFPLINTSKGTDFSQMYNECSSAMSFPQLDTRNGINFDKMYRKCSSAKEFPNIDTSNANNLSGLYNQCSNALSFSELNTSKCKDFSYLYYDCNKAKKVSDIDLFSITEEDITKNNKLQLMLYNCNNLPSVTFNNVPVGITVEQMRTATSAPETCEIILNYRSE